MKSMMVHRERGGIAKSMIVHREGVYCEVNDRTQGGRGEGVL